MISSEQEVVVCQIGKFLMSEAIKEIERTADAVTKGQMSPGKAFNDVIEILENVDKFNKICPSGER